MTRSRTCALLAVLALVAVALCSCAKKESAPTQAEEELARRIGFDGEVLLALKKACGGTIEQLAGMTEGGDEIPVNGLTVSVPYKKAPDIVHKLRSELRPKGYLVFTCELTFERDLHEPLSAVGVLKGTDQYDIVRLRQTNGTNYGVDSAALIAKLRQWEKRYPFEILGADLDWVEIEFEEVPADADSLAKEAYELCPDSVDQGAGSLKALEADIRKQKSLFLWWD